MTRHRKDRDEEKDRDRHDLWLAILLVLLGFACLWVTGILAITPPSSWQISANMFSNINPDAGDGDDVKLIEPVGEEALTPLPPGVLTPMGTPSPVPIAVIGKPVEATATPTPQPTVVAPTSRPTVTPVPYTDTPSPVPTELPTLTPTVTRLPTFTPTGTSTPPPTLTPTNTSVPPPPTSVPSTNTPVPPPTDTPVPPTDTPTPTTDAPPDAPINLRAAAGDSMIGLGWDDLTIEADLAGYRVYSSTSPGGPFNLHATVAITEYLDLSVTNAITYYYQATAFDTGSNESGPSNIASATPYNLAPYTYTTTIDTCFGPADCSAAAGPQDSGVLDLGVGEYVTLDFGDGYGIMDGPGYDMVFYENPNVPGILLDFITIEISHDGLTWYTVFDWDGAPGGVSGTNIDSYATDGLGEEENEAIPSGSLYNNTGVAIDIGPWTPGGYSFRYVRLTDAGGTDAAQIDAVERLN
jgi:hypothetical protein